MSRTYPTNHSAASVTAATGRAEVAGVTARNGWPAPQRLENTAARRWHLAAKRTIDFTLALLFLVIVMPLLVAIAIVIKLDSPGPVFFRQRRLGRDMRPFTVLKFRTMAADAAPDRHREYIAELARCGYADDGEGLKKLTDDPRVTRVGRVLRRLSIDEVPQLINVVCGQMSLVGPRPALEYELEHYDAPHFDRFRVRPGLTGLWQVSGRNRLGFKRMLELDAEYARTATLATDFLILARTPGAAIRHAA